MSALSRAAMAFLCCLLPALAGAQDTTSLRLPVPRNDFCTFLAKRLNDPFFERDAFRCGDASDKLRADNEANYDTLYGEYCQELASTRRKPQLATDRSACIKAANEVGTAETMDWNHPNRVAERAFVEGAVAGRDINTLQTSCAYLAEKHGDRNLASDETACSTFKKAQYRRSPAESTADYRAYCESLGPGLNGVSGGDLMRFCYDLDQHIGITQSSVRTNQEFLAERDRAWTIARYTPVVLILAGIAGAYYLFAVFPGQRRRAADCRRDAQIKARSERELKGFGPDPDARERTLLEGLDRRDGTFVYDEDGFEDGGLEITFRLTRALATLEPKELTAVRIAYLLYNRGLIDHWNFDNIRFGALYGDGKAQLAPCDYKVKPGVTAADPPAAVALYARYRGLTSAGAASTALSVLQHLADSQGEQHPMVKLLRGRVTGGGTWLTRDDVPHSAFVRDPANPYRLLLGGHADGSTEILWYQGDGSIITVAPPGAGKTQCHVLPNLVLWPGAAVVLDVKGDLYPATKGWREKNVGPVFRFAPLDPVNSHCFNPLAFVRGDRFNVWEDSRYLADMLVVRGGSGDQHFWDDRARDLFTAIIADACFQIPPEQRSMNHLHAVANRVGWTEFVARLCATTDVAAMREEGNSLIAIQDKTLDGVLQTLKVTLQPWAGERLREVTKRSDWNPLVLRSDRPATIYLCLKPGEIDAFASVLRVFVGMHLRALTADLPPRGAPPILFMLDELPRLKHMPPIEEALETGRQYGIRLWMFAQSLGQLRQAYKNADGMIGSCAVQAYMNPSGHDGTAEKISEQLGYQEGALDGQRRKIVEASELTGPNYKDLVIVLGANSKPARVMKVFAHQTFRDRLDGAA